MYDKVILEKYAQLIVKVGMNVQKDQPVIVKTAPDGLPLAREVVKAAYEAGSNHVRVDINDSQIGKMNYQYQTKETLAEIPDWVIDREFYYINKGCCMVNILSMDPDAMVGIDPEKVKTFQLAFAQKGEKIMNYSMSNVGQWCVVAYPCLSWAKKVFPNDTDKVAMKKLGDAILKTVRITKRNDPIKAWKKHNNEIRKHSRIMNQLDLKELHYTNGMGTDLVIKLPENHLWEGGCEKTSNGKKTVFNPNMPTEEVFSLPHKDGVDGIVYASKPLVYSGNVIDGFWLKFKDGKVVDYDAKQGKEYLKMLVELDEGSSHLGEVALVQYDSPISKSGILFFNTLFDENASCHLALGRAYPMNIKGGTKMSKEQLSAAGVNSSFTHVDFMVGTADLNIVGTKKDGTKVQIFKEGNFAF